MGTVSSYRDFFLLCSLVIAGTFIFYNFSQEQYVTSTYGILISFIIYVMYSSYIHLFDIQRTQKEIILEAIAVFSLFLFPLLAYGFVLYSGIIEGILLLILFSFTQFLNFARNWSESIHFSKGFPIILHGIFFPLTLFLAQQFAPSFEAGIFVFYFIITSILSLTSYNFIEYEVGSFDRFKQETTNIQSESGEKNEDVSYQGDNAFLHSIPYLKKSTSKDSDIKIEDSLSDESDDFEEYEDLDKEDEQFFNSIEKLK